VTNNTPKLRESTPDNERQSHGSGVDEAIHRLAEVKAFEREMRRQYQDSIRDLSIKTDRLTDVFTGIRHETIKRDRVMTIDERDTLWQKAVKESPSPKLKNRRDQLIAREIAIQAELYYTRGFRAFWLDRKLSRVQKAITKNNSVIESPKGNTKTKAYYDTLIADEEKRLRAINKEGMSRLRKLHPESKLLLNETAELERIVAEMAYQLDDIKDVKETVKNFGSAPPAPTLKAAPTPSPFGADDQSFMDGALDDEGIYTVDED